MNRRSLYKFDGDITTVWDSFQKHVAVCGYEALNICRGMGDSELFEFFFRIVNAKQRKKIQKRRKISIKLKIKIQKLPTRNNNFLSKIEALSKEYSKEHYTAVYYLSTEKSVIKIGRVVLEI